MGVRTPGTEVPERAERIRAGARGRRGADRRGAPPRRRGPCGGPLRPSCSPTWRSAPGASGRRPGSTATPARTGSSRTSSPPPACSATSARPTRPRPAARAGSVRLRHDDPDRARAPGRRRARGADVALTATRARARAVSGAAYACCRPPGHHATRTAFGGSCYLNNTAVAAARLREATGGPVAVIDIDAHHGNGTQSIFYADSAGAHGLGPRRPRRRLVPPLPRLRGRDAAAARGPARTATCRWRRAPATRAGSTRSRRSPSGPPKARPRPSSSRLASTPRAATRRARSR